MGFGSALGSVGGDFTSLSVNPAGIGVYRRSEVMFTPSLKFNSADATYMGELNDDNTVKFNFNNLGIVFTRAERGKRYDRASWKAVSFGVGINRLADFNRRYTYGGLMQGPAASNEHSSFSELFVNDANEYPGSIDVEGSLAYLGYQSYLINQDPQSGAYYSQAFWEPGLNQLRSVQEKGGINELVFSFGGNYQERLMLGATLGVPIVRYTRDAFFEETDASGDPNNDFASFRYRQSLVTTGSGVNLKLGAIYRASDQIRLGAAIHTPTWMSLTEAFNESLTANTESLAGIVDVANPENRFEYHMTTPWRAVLSATGFLGTSGFITADYEYVGYNSMRFRFENEYSDAERVRNQELRNNFQGTSNFRLGAEFRLDNIFIRGGGGYYGNPYKDGDNKMSRLDLSLGLGYRTESFFMDLGFVHSRFDQTERPYTLPEPVVVPVADIEHSLNNIALTIGWKL